VLILKEALIFFLVAWKLIRSWMAAEAERFIKFVNAKSITEYISPDQLSKRMGGTANDP
jgi:hypothetical protein